MSATNLLTLIDAEIAKLQHARPDCAKPETPVNCCSRLEA
jgi:hypothetical protein